jgi:membrane protein implicated in regulation of membrane protease activity
MEQESKHLGIALRNGLFTALAAPGFTLVVVGVGALIVVLSVVLIFPLFLGVPCLVILLGNRAVIERLGTYQVREKEAGQVNQDHKGT